MKTSRSEINLLSQLKSVPIDIKTPRTNIITRTEETIKNIDVNYSVYVDNPELASSPDSMVNRVYPKQNDKWVDSNLVHRCQLCEMYFTFLNRKHHCRACGGVFCSTCCNKYIEIPENLIKVPEKDISLKMNIKNTLTTLNWFTKDKTQLVCNTCEKKIDDLKKVDYLIKIFEFLDLKSLYEMKKVCKNYNVATTLLLSKFRDIQYGVYNKSYSLWEKYILYESRDYLINHTTWFTNLIKSIIEYTQNTKNNDRIKWLENTLKLMLNNNNYKIKNISCFTLMCSRKCKNSIDFDDILEVFEYILYTIKKDETILEINELKNTIILCTRIIFNKIINKIHTIIPLICEFYNNLFEYEIINLDNIFVNKLFDIIFAKTHYIKKTISLITYEKYYYENNSNTQHYNTFFKLSTKYINDIHGTKLLNDITKMMISINNIINDKTSSLDFPFIYPFNPNYLIIKINNKSYFKSNTKPLLVDVIIKNSDDNMTKNVKFIIKKTKTLRKEQLISCLVDILQYKMTEQYEEVPTYQIIMLTIEIGLMEYIENSITLRSINEKGYTLQNFILNKNLHNKLDTIKTRFVHSLAISSAIAYIIGLGDRHLDNIMINTVGSIFHVDYGYIMENPTIIFNMPEIKVTDDIIDFLGGNNSIYYNEFKKLIVKIYNQYRANKNILYIYFKFICDSGFLDWNIAYNKLDSKLMTGMKCKDVEITLINEIESSNTYVGFISDMCHSYKQKLFS
jgi:phosphatidylinositol 3-kinase